MRAKLLRAAWAGVLLCAVALPLNAPAGAALSRPRPPVPAPPSCDPSQNVFSNPGFESPQLETGSLAPWVIDGTNPPPTISHQNPHSGRLSALLGTLSGPEPLGDGSFYQQVTVPVNPTLLSFWYWPLAAPTVDFDWQDAYITDANGTILATIFHRASDAETWLNQTFDMTPYAGQTVRLKFLVHEDGFGDDTAMYVDDVCLSPQAPSGHTSAAPSPA